MTLSPSTPLRLDPQKEPRTAPCGCRIVTNHVSTCPELPDAPAEEVGVSLRRAMAAIEKIVVVMSERGLRDDIALSEIQDHLTIAGYDVPLRGYQQAGRASGVPDTPRSHDVERHLREAQRHIDTAFETLTAEGSDGVLRPKAEVVGDEVDFAEVMPSVIRQRSGRETPE